MSTARATIADWFCRELGYGAERAEAIAARFAGAKPSRCTLCGSPVEPAEDHLACTNKDCPYSDCSE